MIAKIKEDSEWLKVQEWLSMMSDFSYEYTSIYCSSTLSPLGVIIFL